MIEGTFLAIEHMSERKGGQGGTVINVASFGGRLETSMFAFGSLPSTVFVGLARTT